MVPSTGTSFISNAFSTHCGHRDDAVRQDRDHRVDPLHMKWTVSLEGDTEVELCGELWQNNCMCQGLEIENIGALIFLSYRKI